MGSQSTFMAGITIALEPILVVTVLKFKALSYKNLYFLRLTVQESDQSFGMRLIICVPPSDGTNVR